MLTEIKLTSHNGIDDTHEPSATLTYTVISDNPMDGPMQISLQGIAPRIADDSGEILGWIMPGSNYRFGNFTDHRLLAGKIEVTDRKVLEKAAEYKIQLDEEGGKVVENKLPQDRIQWTVKQTFKERPEYTIVSKHETEKVRFLYDVLTGRPIVNSAGGFFPQGEGKDEKWPMMEIPILVYEITRFEVSNPINRRELYTYAVNSDSWCGATPGTILMDSVLPKWNGNSWEVTYAIKFKHQGWGKKYLDEGLQQIVNGRLVPILNNEGVISSTPEKLDGSGRRAIARDHAGNPILDSDGNEQTDPGFPGILYPPGNDYYWKYKMLPFADLGLPDITLPISKTHL